MRTPNWYKVEKDGVCFYKAWNFEASGLVKHGFSTRIGGHSSTPYDTLNLGLAVQDDPISVVSNRRAFADTIGVDCERIIVPQQVHFNVVAVVGEAEAGSGAVDHSTAIADTDALITNNPNVPLALHFADCTCIFLLDPEKKAIGVAHAGWKGTNLRIVSNTMDAMVREYGTEPSKLLAAIAPSICRNCYVVGEDVACALYKSFDGDERVIKQASSTKWRADLKMANYILLRKAGVLDTNIAISEECTSCNHKDFFSYRRSGVTGRMGGWMSLV